MTALPPPSPATLLAWYDRHARRLPWRIGPADRRRGVTPDPYRVWLSEIMLQQTTVAAVKPYFEGFLARWPDVAALAAAPSEEVMKAWAGLGYYSRARNLKAAAETVAREHGGRFPATEAGLTSLPGIGSYTAAAIAAIAFDQPAAVVDGNVERVLSRVFAVETPLPAAKTEIRRLQAGLTQKERPGDYAQAMMDLGATICTPRRPACSLCPWSENCAAHAAGIEESFPVKPNKAARPERTGTAFVARRRDGAVLLRRRAEKGLLGGMTEVPGSDWLPSAGPASTAATAPIAASWQAKGVVVHVFTHFRLTLSILAAEPADNPAAPEGHWWSSAEELPGEALPSVMKKAIETAFPGATKRRR
ncbi:A/G-specific adenine glycosylase [Kaistia geumhonensis]|uniref:Adenine DNA glycosylase n=1 Tax=Kaistia geumhonensis TaxID=410839 RepID=A0ABU0MBD6_9HYPH|nr:A/G-specific adenine glycosylase [Kaistia geumhonensis]MCX5481210.1 A/G-specific adenine glycosylase [Kaistia geumhonensis]MDQ0518271.1 A/G-specific adenine glycosylase [Kaistia geumhonensis]